MPTAEFAGDYLVGLQPGAHLRRRKRLRRPRRVQAASCTRRPRAGIAVILDVVYNHFGPSDLDLWQFDGWSENDGGGIYFYNDWNARNALGQHAARLRPRRGAAVHP